MTTPDSIEAVFFDLDGTLLDTAPDLWAACNLILKQYHHPLVPIEKFRQWIHGGAVKMITESFQISAQDTDFQEIKTLFLEQYDRIKTNQTHFFPGIEQVLTDLEQKKIPWGVITNKFSWLTEPLLAHFGLTSRMCCTISADNVKHAKPNPEPLLMACQIAHCKPEHAIYIGDTWDDIRAAHAAGMKAIAVTYGYHSHDNEPVEWQAEALASTPLEIIPILQNLMMTWSPDHEKHYL